MKMQQQPSSISVFYFLIPLYQVQYFVQDPFIIHMYSYKQLEIFKLIDNKDIVINLDATGSFISNPTSGPKKIISMPLQFNTLTYPPVRTL